MKKRLVSLILCAVMLCAAFAIPVNAAEYKVNDPIGSVLYTDIVTYIDGYAIQSYNINWNTYIVVEDLLKYGFGVLWDGTAKTLTVSTARTAAPADYTADYTPGKLAGEVGTEAMKYLYTDIVTFIGTKEVTSYNIGGFTCICVDDLAANFAASYVYDDAKRTLSMTSPAFGGGTAPVVPDVEVEQDEDIIAAAKAFMDSLIETEIGISEDGTVSSEALAEFAELGQLYGEDITAMFADTIQTLYADFVYEVTGAKMTASGVEVYISITMRDLSNVMTVAMENTMAEVYLALSNSIQMTEEEITAAVFKNMITAMADPARELVTTEVTAYLNVGDDGAIALADSENAELYNALVGGLMNDPIIADLLG